MTSGVPDSVLLPLSKDEHLLGPLLTNAEHAPYHDAALRRVDGEFVSVTALELSLQVQAVARGLMAKGVGPGDRVALLSATSFEWTLLDYAIMAAGGVTVPIYETSSAEQIEWIMRDSEAVLLVASTQPLATRWMPPAGASCTEILTIESGAIQDLIDAGQSVPADRLRNRLDQLDAETMATIIYTSGTTGRPKGCVLTHGNLRSNVAQMSQAIAGSVGPTDRTLLFLPLAHVLARTTAFFCVENEITIAYSAGLNRLPHDLRDTAPTLLVAVPRVLEKVYNTAHRKAAVDGKGRVFDWSTKVAEAYSRQHRSGGLRPWTKLAHGFFDGPVYEKVRGAFGGSLRLVFCGGAPLGERLTSYYDGVGIRVLEGYGLTETSPLLTMNAPSNWKAGSVGRSIAGTTLRLTGEGEIQARGPQVFSRYWNNRGATDDVLDADGWFSTGDIGELDDDGFLTITGRSKDLIVTSGGKNVAPAPLEDRLRAHELISQAVVIGDGRPFVAALLTIDTDALKLWASSAGIPIADVRSNYEHPSLRQEIEKALVDANKSVSTAEAIRKFKVLPSDFTIGSSELTPSLKVRRDAVVERYRSDIDQLYASAA